MTDSNSTPDIFKREYLLLASYCGGDSGENCTEEKPCTACLAMCNIFDSKGKFLRQLGKVCTPTEAQPVAWAEIDADGIYAIGLHKSDKLTTPLYAAPPTDNSALVKAAQAVDDMMRTQKAYERSGVGPALRAALASREAPPAVTVEQAVKRLPVVWQTDPDDAYGVNTRALVSRDDVLRALGESS